MPDIKDKIADVLKKASNMDAESGHGASHSPNQLHVVMLLNYLPLHFVSCMRHLKQRVKRLSFLLSVPMEAQREWKPQFADFDVTIQRTLSYKTVYHHPHGFDYPGKVYLPVSTPLVLMKLRPDVVISLEVGPRTIQAFLLRYLGFRYKLIVQLRESETSALSRGRMRHLLRRWILPHVDQVMVNGRSGERYAKSCGVSNDRITVVPSGTDLTHFGNRPKVLNHDSPLKLLYVGAIIPLKGIAAFIPHLATSVESSQRRVVLTLLGKGEDEEVIKTIPVPDHLKICWHPYTEYQDLEAVYSQHDVLVMPSLCDEWGMVVNEAMACGLPVLGCLGSQAVEELVSDGVNGWTYPSMDEHAMKAAIGRMLETSAVDMAGMANRAHETALACSDEHAAEKIIKAIKRSLHR